MCIRDRLRTTCVTSVLEARALLTRNGQLGVRRNFGLAVFPGSFNPPSIMHCEIARQVMSLPGVNSLWLDMTIHRTKKLYLESLREDRVQMTELAAQGIEHTAVTTLMANMGDAGWTRTYFDVLRELAGKDSCIHWVIGSDVVEDMRYYPEKATTLLQSVDYLIVFARQIHEKDGILEILQGVTGWSSSVLKKFVLFRKLGQETELVSSSNVRRVLTELHKLVPTNVLRHVINSDSLLEFYQDVGATSPNVRMTPPIAPKKTTSFGDQDPTKDPFAL
eukprot:TRINITY_DN7602_c0_g1_i2.p1 TRINITY_DN7602_c0_g1~~TRINITY_DN7602_c0_g1_i2.p1  ORF type:complete len:277 (+),score=41.53 TRINITY_DN7602_c0_g1_i2:98-928(+)